MSWKINVLFLVVFVLFGCKDKEVEQMPVVKKEPNEMSHSYLVEVDELSKLVGKPDIKIIDFRKPEFYLDEHIPGALNIWRTDIEDLSYPYKGIMISKEQLEVLFSNLGIKNSDTIIIYDDNGLCDSSRLWWILQNYDFTGVKLFHGGFKAWKENNGEVTSELPKIVQTVFKLPEYSSMKYYVSKADMVEALYGKTILLDTRTDDEFSGKRQKSGAAKGGRIPNSKWIDWSSAIDYHGDLMIKPYDELDRIYKQLASKNDTIIVYCHSGVRSAHTTFILTQLLGYKNVRNYDGSWTEWSYFEDLPFEQDSITTIKQ
ncbi:sulfurtransferase [uncultured Psychroserpens sp.]|uniref:sulfurtransferase n=1 Tax=uncultured Psychroserpens sp. TaxID=255436 RepID=UPI002632AE82|nr:sulfurtransferase [uncultured Psychroserpens sp.]